MNDVVSVLLVLSFVSYESKFNDPFPYFINIAVLFTERRKPFYMHSFGY